MNTGIVDPSTEIYRSTDDYVHAIEVRGATRQLLVSGTMGLNERGEAPTNLDDQLDLIWSNIRRILSEADMTVSNIVRLTSYLAKREFAESNAAARVVALEGRTIPTTAIVVDLLDPTWLVEIEVVAMD